MEHLQEPGNRAELEANRGWGSVLHRADDEDLSLVEKRAALIGLAEPENGQAPDRVRHYLYQLTHPELVEDWVDLGNLHLTADREQNCQTIAYIVCELVEKQVVPVFIGGGGYLAYGLYLGMEWLKEWAHFVGIDSRLFFQPEEPGGLDDHNYLQKMFFREQNFLFNFSNIGYQTYFVEKEALDLLEKLYFDSYRLGAARQDLREVEPIIRSGNLFSFSMSAVRQSEAPAAAEPSPNGFDGEEAAALARYAGTNAALEAAGFWGYQAGNDRHGQTAHLLAQMVWYFADGMASQVEEHPTREEDQFTIYHTECADGAYTIRFFKSRRTDRWWMAVPYDDQGYEQQHLVPCSYADYQQASEGEMPERWWKAFQKLS